MCLQAAQKSKKEGNKIAKRKAEFAQLVQTVHLIEEIQLLISTSRYDSGSTYQSFVPRFAKYLGDELQRIKNKDIEENILPKERAWGRKLHMKFLDLGSGVGEFTHAMNVAHDMRCVGLEVSPPVFLGSQLYFR